MSDHLLILRLSGDFYTKARRTRMRFFRRLVSNLEAALKAHGIPYRWSRPGAGSTWRRPTPARPRWRRGCSGCSRSPRSSGAPGRPWTTWWRPASSSSARRCAGGASPSAPAAAASADRIGFDSTRIEIALGRALLEAGAGRVNLSEPEVTAHVELEPGSAHLFFDKVHGPRRAADRRRGAGDRPGLGRLRLGRGELADAQARRAARLRLLQPRRRRPPARRAAG